MIQKRWLWWLRPNRAWTCSRTKRGRLELAVDKKEDELNWVTEDSSFQRFSVGNALHLLGTRICLARLQAFLYWRAIFKEWNINRVSQKTSTFQNAAGATVHRLNHQWYPLCLEIVFLVFLTKTKQLMGKFWILFLFVALFWYTLYNNSKGFSIIALKRQNYTHSSERKILFVWTYSPAVVWIESIKGIWQKVWIAVDREWHTH